jgi:ribA/ribD-fused uncharacterized protein
MIEQFRGNNFYLSNMYFLENWVTTEQGFAVPTSEHAYQAAKFVDLDAHKQVALATAELLDYRVYADGLAAREMAHSLIEQGAEIRSDWEVAQNGLMLAVNRQKFARNRPLVARLIDSGDEEIVEGNDWGDRKWGVDPVGSHNGENRLGKILMQIRSEAMEGII